MSQQPATRRSVGLGIIRHGKYKACFVLVLLGLALIILTSFPTASDLFQVASKTKNISCDNNYQNDYFTATPTTTSNNAATIKNAFQNDPNPNEPWPRIAWLMTYPNSVRTSYVLKTTSQAV